ncbi:putative ribosome biogenesis protein Ssf2 [Elsinoe ampelina]|uniref:Putative ribosome biogenesis protein Ssf2 n=1 Tax=Elsinoe ampelina TaxID=302913 RepID=A0A6A6GL09_9PEZI|nr:putative ribosome biogenesis protein Ssf2 [Elsinoe ampelina]
MAKRRVKKRTQAPQDPNGGPKVPKSMVIRIGAGDVGPAVTQLVQDVREVMEPHTASKLRERKGNRLKDYVTMAGPLGVSHLFLFSRSENGNTNLRLAIAPRGPTLHFRVNNYSLCRDIARSLKRAKAGYKEHLTSPLLVMNNFNSGDNPHPAVPKHLESLTTSVFQSLFAPINPQATPLDSIKRILLLDRIQPKPDSEDAPFLLSFRHYAISTPPAKSSLPRALRRLNTATHASQPSKKRLPNLGKLGDMSDFLLDPTAAGFTSASESELDSDAEVEVLAPNVRRAMTKDERSRMREEQRARIEQNAFKERVEKKAIKLTELGPRMTLRLTKVEEGLCGGKVMWHEYIHKSKAEVSEMERVWAKRKKEKEERRKIQKENVERKRKERGANGQTGEDEDEDISDMGDEDDDFWDDEEGEDLNGEQELDQEEVMEVEEE